MERKRTYKYAELLTDCDNKDRSWLYQLENCALKKQANEELFGEIKRELKDALQEDDEEKFSVDRLRAKFKSGLKKKMTQQQLTRRVLLLRCP